VERSAGKERKTERVVPRPAREASGPRSNGVVADPGPAGCPSGARVEGAVDATAGPPLSGLAGGPRRAATVRVLLAIEEEHRIYCEAIGRYLQIERPDLEVRMTGPCRMYSELRRFGPQIVLYAGPPTPVPDLLPCWIELSIEPCRPTVLRAGKVRKEVLNPSLSGLLALIDEGAPVCR